MAENNLEILNLEIKVSADEALAKISEVKSGLRGLNNIKVDAKIDTVAKQAEESAQSAESSAKRIKTAMEDAASSVDKGASKAKPAIEGAFKKVDFGASAFGNINIDSSNVAAEAKEEGKKVGEAFEDGIKDSLDGMSSILNGMSESLIDLTEAQKKKESESVKIDFQKAFDGLIDPKVYAFLGSVQEKLEAIAGIKVGAEFKSLAIAVSIAKKAIEVIKKIIDGIKKQLKEMANVAKKISKFFAKLEPFHGWEKKLASLIGTLQRQVLRKAINYMLTSISQGFTSGLENLEAYDARFKATMQSLRSSLGLFQNSLVVAVAPIINYVAPALNKLMSMLTAACNQIARLTALLTGQKTYTIAKGYEDIADSAGSATDAAKELEATILGFDEINKLNGDSGSSSGSGSGTSDGISTYETIDVGDWQYKSWGEAFLAFVDWLNSTGVPKLNSALSNVAKTFNDFNRNIVEMLSFDGVQDAIAELGANIGTALNDFVNHGIDWKSWGQAFGLSIQTGLNFAANMFRSFNFNELGTNLANWVNSAINKINPKDLATMLMSKITAGIRLAASFLSSPNLGDWGTWAAQVVNNMVSELSNAWATVSPGNIRTNVSNFFTNLFDGINWDELFDTLEQVADDIFDTLGGIWEDLQSDESFTKAVRRAGEFVAGLAWKWFIAKLKIKLGLIGDVINSFFGTDTAEIQSGGYEGTRQDIIAMQNALGDTVDDSSSSYKKFGNTATSTNKKIIASSANMSAKLKTTSDEMSKSMKTAADNMSSSASGCSSSVGHHYKTMSDSVKTTLNDLSKSTYTPAYTAAKNVSDSFWNAKTNSTKYVNETKSNIKNSLNDLSKSTYTPSYTAAKKISDSFWQAKKYSTQYAGETKSGITGQLKGLSSSISPYMESAKNTIVGKMNEGKTTISNDSGWRSVGTNISNGIITGQNSWSSGLLASWANSFKSAIKRLFGIRSPSRWARDNVGNYITEGISLGMTNEIKSVTSACDTIMSAAEREFADFSYGGFGSVSFGKMDVASSISGSIATAVTASLENNDQPIVCEVYLDTNQIATAVTTGQNRQNRRYSSVAMA